MRIVMIAAAGLAALGLVACESKADKAAEVKADAIEDSTEAKADALEDQGQHAAADQVEQQGDAVADKVEQDAAKKD